MHGPMNIKFTARNVLRTTDITTFTINIPYLITVPFLYQAAIHNKFSKFPPPEPIHV
jgi:hypothetical protein